jgi:lysozyme
MNIGPDGIALIKHFESCSLKAYPDPATNGPPITICWGHTGPEVKLGQTLTYPECEALLALDLRRFEAGVDAMLTRDVTPNQFDSLVSLAFNIGLGNLKGSTLMKRMNAGEDEAAKLQFLVWNRAVGKVMKGLQRRRKAESLVFAGFDADVAIAESLREHP